MNQTKYETLMSQLLGDEGIEKNASMSKTAAFEFGEAMAEGFYTKLAELVAQAADEQPADASADPAAAPAAAPVAATANDVASQTAAAQNAVSDQINAGSAKAAPNPGNDYTPTFTQEQINAIVAQFKANPDQIPVMLSQLTQDEINELLKIPDIAALIKPVLTAASTNTGPVNVSGTSTPNPANTPGATPVV